MAGFSSLRLRLLLLILLATIPAFGLILYTGLDQRRMAAAQAQREALRLVRRAASDHERLIEGGRQLLFGLAQVPRVGQGDPTACNAFLAALLKQYPFYANLTVTARRGEVLCSAVPLTQPVNAAPRSWFQRAIQTRSFALGDYQIGRITGKSVLVLASPVLSRGGQVEAVVAAALDLAWLNQFAARAELSPGVTLTVLDRHGTILVHYPDPEKWVGRTRSEDPMVKAILTQPGEGTTITSGLDGIPRLIAFTRLQGAPEGEGVYVAVGIPRKIVFAKLNRLFALNLAGLGIVTLLALVAARVGGELFILRPVNALVSATRRLASGDLSARTGLPPGGELGQLARAFDEMAEALDRHAVERKQAEEALARSEQKFRELVQSLDVIMWEADPVTWRFTFVSHRAEAILGYPVQQWLTDPHFWVDHIHPEDREASVSFCRMATSQGKDHQFEYRALAADGRVVWLRDIVRVNSDAEGRVRQLCGVMVDITERKQTEEALVRRTRQLEAVRAVGTEITRELDLPTLLDLIVRRAAELVGADNGTVCLWNEELQVVIPQAWHGLGEWVRQVRYHLGESVTGTVAQRRQGMIVNDYRTSPYCHPLFAERTQAAALVAEPLLYRDRLVGAITLGSDGGRPPFTEQDREILALFATQAAIAIENAQLYEEAKRRQNAAEALAEVGRLVSQSLDPEEVAQRIVDNVRRLLDVQAATLFRLEPESGDLVTIATSSDVQPVLVKNEVLPQDSATVGLAVRERKPVTTSDFLTDPRITLTPELRARLEQLPYRAVLAVPLVAQGGVIGALSVGYPAGRVFGQEGTRLVEAFADQGAIALENAQMFKQVRAGRERLQVLSRKLVEVQEVERRHIARELHDEIGQVLTGLKLTLEMSSRLPADAARTSLIEAQTLVNDLIAQVRELSLDLRPAILDDLGLLPALLAHFERYTAKTRVRVTLEHAGLGRRFPSEVETAAYRIVQEALTNIARHAGVGEASVGLWADEERLGVQIEDGGAGFDPDAVLSAVTSSGLVGMRERAVLVGGHLSVQSAPGAGTRLMAELPLGRRFEKRKKER